MGEVHWQQAHWQKHWCYCLQLGSMIVGLPAVTLQFPKTLAAWLRLRTFTQCSFESPDMVRVEVGFAAILLLVLILQVRPHD